MYTPTAVTAPTVSSMETVASCTGIRQRAWRSGSSSFMPELKSEISTATSVTRSSMAVFFSASSDSNPQPRGPMATPSARYNMAALSGSRDKNEPPSVITTSSKPAMTHPRVNRSGLLMGSRSNMK